MKRAPRSRQRHDLYAKYHDYDSEISDLLGECGLERLRGQRSAFERPGGAILEVVAALQARQFDELRQRFNDWQIVRGIRGLPDGFEPTDLLFDLLRDIYRDADGNANVRSGVFSAAARLDELENPRQPR